MSQGSTKERLCDYFAIVGPDENAMLQRDTTSQDHKIPYLKRCLEEAITDICVFIYPKEKTPPLKDGWEILDINNYYDDDGYGHGLRESTIKSLLSEQKDKSAGDNEKSINGRGTESLSLERINSYHFKLAKHAYICYRRRKYHRTNSFISDIILYRKNIDTLESGYEVIEQTTEHNQADLGKFSVPYTYSLSGMSGGGSSPIYIAIKRQILNEEAWNSNTGSMILDLSLCHDKEGHTAPQGHKVLHDFPLTKLGSSDNGYNFYGNSKNNSQSHRELYLGFRRGPSVGICDIPFPATTLEHYPSEETNKEFPLPRDQLPMFCFPQGLRLTYFQKRSVPMPKYFSFVFTQGEGEHVHTSCLQFYELVSDQIQMALEAEQRQLQFIDYMPDEVKERFIERRWSEVESDNLDEEVDDEDQKNNLQKDQNESTFAKNDSLTNLINDESSQSHYTDDNDADSLLEIPNDSIDKSLNTGNGYMKSLRSKVRGESQESIKFTESFRNHMNHLTQDSTGTTEDLITPSRNRKDIISDSEYGFFAPRTICIITRWPIYQALRRFLRQLYRISMSPSRVPIERYIAYLIEYIPLPPPGTHAIHLHLDINFQDDQLQLSGKGFGEDENKQISDHSIVHSETKTRKKYSKFTDYLYSAENSSLAPIEFKLPGRRSLPLMDLDFDIPFRCLDLDNIISVFLLMLAEEKLLFLCSSASVLTEVIECMTALLFPLEWITIYIPRLPMQLQTILEAPGRFLIGIHAVEGTKNAIMNLPELDDPIYIVDLDNNKVHSPPSHKLKAEPTREPLIIHELLMEESEEQSNANSNKNSFIGITSPTSHATRGSTQSNAALQGLAPYERNPLATLKSKLKAELSFANVILENGDLLKERDGAFFVFETELMGGAVVRDAFLTFMCEILGHYSNHFNSQEERDENEEINGVFAIFDKSSFVKAVPHPNLKPLIEKIVITQMFSKMIQERSERGPGIDKLVFFESCVQELHDRANCYHWLDSARQMPSYLAQKSPSPIQSPSLKNADSSAESHDDYNKYLHRSRASLYNDGDIGGYHFSNSQILDSPIGINTNSPRIYGGGSQSTVFPLAYSPNYQEEFNQSSKENQRRKDTTKLLADRGYSLLLHEAVIMAEDRRANSPIYSPKARGTKKKSYLNNDTDQSSSKVYPLKKEKEKKSQGQNLEEKPLSKNKDDTDNTSPQPEEHLRKKALRISFSSDSLSIDESKIHSEDTSKQKKIKKESPVNESIEIRENYESVEEIKNDGRKDSDTKGENTNLTAILIDHYTQYNIGSRNISLNDGLIPVPSYLKEHDVQILEEMPPIITLPAPGADDCESLVYSPQSRKSLYSTSKYSKRPNFSNEFSDGDDLESGDDKPKEKLYQYTKFPRQLNESYMSIPPEALPVTLPLIQKKRALVLRKNKRMFLARSLSECMKDWMAIGSPQHYQLSHQNKSGKLDSDRSENINSKAFTFNDVPQQHREIHLAMQIFGIYFMCLPTRVKYKGRPLSIIMEAIGLLEFLINSDAVNYIDEAMWRSLLVACGRCGHRKTRKIAIAIFNLLREIGTTINALTYGEYTKALAEEDAVDVDEFVNLGEGENFNSTISKSISKHNGATQSINRLPVDSALPNTNTSSTSPLFSSTSIIDVTPWLERNGRAWYEFNCASSITSQDTEQDGTAILPLGAAGRRRSSRNSVGESTLFKQNISEEKEAPGHSDNSSRDSISNSKSWNEKKLKDGKTKFKKPTQSNWGIKFGWGKKKKNDKAVVSEEKSEGKSRSTPLSEEESKCEIRTISSSDRTNSSEEQMLFGDSMSGKSNRTGRFSIPSDVESSSNHYQYKFGKTYHWSKGLRDPTFSVRNTNINSKVEYYEGVIGMWMSSICANCSYIPMDEEIMAIRTDMLLHDQSSQMHYLLCPRCKSSLGCRLFYHVFPTDESNLTANNESYIDVDNDDDGSIHLLQEDDLEGQNFFQPNDTLPKKKYRKLGEFSGIGPEDTLDKMVSSTVYLSPFTLRTKIERLLLENGEVVLTRLWLRENHPEVYWNVLWYCTRLSVPFPFLIESLGKLSDSTINLRQTRNQGYSQSYIFSTNNHQLLRQDTFLDRTDFSNQVEYFPEVIVLGGDGENVKEKCKYILAQLKCKKSEGNDKKDSVNEEIENIVNEKDKNGSIDLSDDKRETSIFSDPLGDMEDKIIKSKEEQELHLLRQELKNNVICRPSQILRLYQLKSEILSSKSDMRKAIRFSHTPTENSNSVPKMTTNSLLGSFRGKKEMEAEKDMKNLLIAAIQKEGQRAKEIDDKVKEQIKRDQDRINHDTFSRFDISTLSLFFLFPNTVENELEMLEDVASLLILYPNYQGLKEAVDLFLQYKEKVNDGSGWTSEYELGIMYRVFLKLVLNFKCKDLSIYTKLKYLDEKIGFESEYVTMLGNLSTRQLRSQAGKTEDELMRELPLKSALKFRSIFGALV